MRYEWDESKRRASLRKHSLDFADASKIFDGLTYTIEDNREDYGEDRYLTFGLLRDKVVVIVHTERGDTIRIISIREALKHEAKAYFEAVGFDLEDS
jgi:uncharacterized DUF497 family protein